MAMAALGDGHTGSGFAGDRPSRVPVRFHQFGEDIVVVAADSAHGALLGGRVTRIGDQDIAAVRATLATYISHDNPWWLRKTIPDWLPMPRALHGTGLLDDPTVLPVTVSVPVIGTPNQITAPADSSRPSNMPSRNDGIALPTRISNGRKGVTSS